MENGKDKLEFQLDICLKSTIYIALAPTLPDTLANNSIGVPPLNMQVAPGLQR
jgi:hypothetical protein